MKCWLWRIALSFVAPAYTVDAAGCSKEAGRLQWLYVGLHASRAGRPEQVAEVLAARDHH